MADMTDNPLYRIVRAQKTGYDGTLTVPQSYHVPVESKAGDSYYMVEQLEESTDYGVPVLMSAENNHYDAFPLVATGTLANSQYDSELFLQPGSHDYAITNLDAGPYSVVSASTDHLYDLAARTYAVPLVQSEKAYITVVAAGEE